MRLNRAAIILFFAICAICNRALAQSSGATGFNLIVVGDTQPQTEEQITRLEREILPEIEAIIREYDTSDTTPEAVLLTGDVVWDTMPYLPRVKAMFESLGVELFTVIGNHDYDRTIVGNEPRAMRQYRRCFGRPYRATTLGNTRLILLDNILYTSYDDYSIGIDRRQMRWLRRTIRRTPEQMTLAIAMHAPATDFRTGELLPYAHEIIAMAEGRELHLITGHRHQNTTHYINPTTTEHSVAQVNGNLWFAPLCVDGTPRGVLRIEERDAEWSWQFHALGHEAEYQMKAYPMGSVAGCEEYIVVKIWGWDDRWSVTYSEAASEPKAMEQIAIYDPDYIDYVENVADYPAIIMERLRHSAQRTAHYFRIKPTSGSGRGTITATDAFGRSYSLSIDY